MNSNVLQILYQFHFYFYPILFFFYLILFISYKPKIVCLNTIIHYPFIMKPIHLISSFHLEKWMEQLFPNNGSNGYDMMSCDWRFLIYSNGYNDECEEKKWKKMDKIKSWGRERRRNKRQMKKREWRNQLLP